MSMAELPKTRRQAAVLNGAMVLCGAYMTTLGPFSARLGLELSLTNAQTGLLLSLSFLGNVLLTLVCSLIADRVGKTQLVAIGLSGFFAALAALAFMRAFAPVAALILLCGGFSGVIQSSASALMADIHPENPTAAVNQTQVSFAVGATFSPVLISLCISYLPYWRGYFVVLAGFMLACCVLALTSGLPRKCSLSSPPMKGFWKLFKTPGFLVACLLAFLYAGGEVGAWSWMASFLQNTRGWGVLASGALVTLFWFSMTVGRYFCGLLLKRFSLRKLLLLMCVLSAAVTALAMAVNSTAAALCVVVGMGLGYSSQFPLILSWGSMQTNVSSGMVFPLILLSGNLGPAVLPALMGLFGDWFGLGVVMWVPTAAFLSVGLLFSVFLRWGRRAEL